MSRSPRLYTDEELLAELERQRQNETGLTEEEGSDTEEEGTDHEDISDHETNSEQSADEENEEELGGDQDVQFFYSKKNKVKWSSEPVRVSGRRSKKDIITHLPGVRPQFRETEKEISAFSLFFSDEIINLLVTCTNIHVEVTCGHYKRPQDHRTTDPEEIKALLGLLILAEVYRASHTNLKDLWGRDGPAVFQLAMSLQRFSFLLRHLRLDDVRDRKDRISSDKLAAVRNLSELLGSKFREVYSLSEYVTIDEQLIPFRGRCSFRQYIPNKPKSYGIKVFALVDAHTFYLHKFEIYAGNVQPGPLHLSNSPTDIVLRLVESIRKTGRNITTDNWYTSYNLAEKLLEEQLTLVGALRKNKEEIPTNFLPSNRRPIHDTIFGFTPNFTLVSYVPKKNKSVILISSMHHDKAIDENSGDAKKPEIITFYNRTKGGVDTNDQLSANYSVGRKTSRWPLAIFYHLLNVAGINSYVVYKDNRRRLNLLFKLERRKFLSNLAHQLLENFIVKRSECSVIPKSLKTKIKLYLDENGVCVLPLETATTSDLNPRKRKRCYICPSSKDTKYSAFCCKCKNNICKEHLQSICINCRNE